MDSTFDRFMPINGDHDLISPNCRIGKNVRLGQCVIEEGCSIGDNVFVGHFTMIRSGVKIGKNSVIGHLVMIEADTEIGEFTTIQSQCHITKYAKIGDHTFWGPMSGCINTHRISHGRGFPAKLEGPVIKFGARIGTGALIMPGVVIGENSVVGAKSLVTKDVPDREVWLGHPARFKQMVLADEILPGKGYHETIGGDDDSERGKESPSMFAIYFGDGVRR